MHTFDICGMNLVETSQHYPTILWKEENPKQKDNIPYFQSNIFEIITWYLKQEEDEWKKQYFPVQPISN